MKQLLFCLSFAFILSPSFGQWTQVDHIDGICIDNDSRRIEFDENEDFFYQNDFGEINHSANYIWGILSKVSPQPITNTPLFYRNSEIFYVSESKKLVRINEASGQSTTYNLPDMTSGDVYVDKYNKIFFIRADNHTLSYANYQNTWFTAVEPTAPKANPNTRLIRKGSSLYYISEISHLIKIDIYPTHKDVTDMGFFPFSSDGFFQINYQGRVVFKHNHNNKLYFGYGDGVSHWFSSPNIQPLILKDNSTFAVHENSVFYIDESNTFNRLYWSGNPNWAVEELGVTPVPVVKNIVAHSESSPENIFVEAPNYNIGSLSDTVCDEMLLFQDIAIGKTQQLSELDFLDAIYPNPTQGILFIHESVQDIVIMDITGDEIQGLKQEDGIIDLSNLNNGVYFVNYQDSNHLFSEKILLSK